MSNKILLVDGMALLFRHFYASSIHKNYMLNSEGTPTNGVQGFVRHIFSAIYQINPTHVAVCWDMGATTFRNETFNDYKGHRPEPPEALKPQFNLVHQVSEALQFENIGVKNYEADDIIGTLTKYLSHSETNEIYIITGDKDLLQCLGERVKVCLIKKGFTEYNVYNKERFENEYGIVPHQLIDVKAFMGDTADGYYGVKGIGERTAIKLIRQYHSVDGVLQHLDELTPRQQSMITRDMDHLKISYFLATIHTDVPFTFSNIENQLRYTFNSMHVLDVCEKYELNVSKNYINKLFKSK
ncbi:5'-3' exonuclease [Staphylococcus canis]|uniref:5'-3' exonuclease n=1 Tax=Staphylococcus canis TaxID=2724942 RepID=A0ABS0T9X6_9STAP|nr:5'-3' exonuclease H3TH domain-containing protein [Staphylococcus canis]MBI5975477.1 5'-3' exonuclease [Staphylococcus canis]